MGAQVTVDHSRWRGRDPTPHLVELRHLELAAFDRVHESNAAVCRWLDLWSLPKIFDNIVGALASLQRLGFHDGGPRSRRQSIRNY